jgi:hypothetical protein
MVGLLGNKTKANHIRKLQKDDLQLTLIVGLVSITCIGVFLLPSEIRNILKVRHGVFNPIACITASFVHDNSLHLGTNLCAFLFTTLPLYLINKRINEQKYFLISLLMMFLVLPLLNYGILFYLGIYKSIEYGFGLSLVCSGLVGFTIPSLTLYFKRKLEKFNSIFFLISMVLFTFSLISYPYKSSFEFPLPVFCAILGSVSGILEIKRILNFLISSLKQSPFESILVIFTICFYLYSIINLFPSAIVLQGGIVDIISHYFGFLFGTVIFPFRYIAKSTTKLKDQITKILKGIQVIVPLPKL